ncbi:unnamed protein product [Caenorhabditis bovis]|uniref:Metalloendopeptidase n=1 Tax=Caenorhabditis bovis TaxID=2654633 RepID=A0A8S1F0C6_9PELO|nr:unnamed protein product [Caenorhabditis bovis]
MPNIDKLLVALAYLITAAFAIQSWEINENSKSSFPLFGDMILTPAQLSRYQNSSKSSPVRSVNLKETSMNRWANNIIPIVISPQYSPAQISIIRNSLKTFEEISCFKFVDRGSQRDYLFIVPLDGCYSYVGKIGGKQTISLAADCIADYIIWHEMMHAIGFEHEHQRPDRDDYIKVTYENVIPSQIVNFDKIQPHLVDYPDQYDYRSIMHYDGSAFGKIDYTKRVRLATMTPLKRGIQLLDNLKFTTTDIRKLNRLGKCSGASGAVSPDKRTKCVDIANDCGQSKKRGMCDNPFYRPMMRRNCQRTCGMCLVSRGMEGDKICEDKHPNCATYVINGICENEFYERWRQDHCAKSCGLCTST